MSYVAKEGACHTIEYFWCLKQTKSFTSTFFSFIIIIKVWITHWYSCYCQNINSPWKRMFLYSFTSLRCGFISIIGWHFYVLYLNCTVSCSLLKEQRLIYLFYFLRVMFLKLCVNLKACVLTGGEDTMWTFCGVMLHHLPTTCSSKLPNPRLDSSISGYLLGPSLTSWLSAK